MTLNTSSSTVHNIISALENNCAGSATFPEITVCEHRSQIQVKALSCKEEAICEHVPEIPLSSEAKWKTDIWSEKSKFESNFGKHGCRALQTNEQKDHSVCYQRSSACRKSQLIFFLV